MSILSDVTEASVVKAVKLHDREGRLVVMDVEGVASRLVSRAISQADLVITPMRATTLDATVGGRALQLVAEEEEALGRTISQAVIFTMTRAIRTRQHAGIEASLEAQGGDIIRPPLLERVAFSALFQFGGNLRTLPAQGNMEAAIDNASHFAQAVYRRLTGDPNERPLLGCGPAKKTRARVRSHKQTRPGNGTGSTLASPAGEEDGHPAPVPARSTRR